MRMKIVTRQQMQNIDSLSTSEYSIPSLLLMEHAAHEIYLAMQKEINKKDRICIVCGHGNNGGDGFALARFLYMNGYSVSIYFVGKEASLTRDAKTNYDICKNVKILFVENMSNATILVDAIFGTGLTRDIEGHYQTVIQEMNASSLPIYSIDIPSGIDCDTGSVLNVAIQASKTYSMQCGKLGLYLQPGRSHVGEVIILPIYIPTQLVEKCESEMYLITQQDVVEYLPQRKSNSHKGTYGKLLCVGGSNAMSGAISLAAKSALASGCGLLTCAIPEGIQSIIQTNVLESMTLPFPEEEGMFKSGSAKQLSKELDSYTHVLFGCGVGKSTGTQEIANILWASSVPLVVDADGLWASKSCLKNRENTILTPHIKEFASIMNVDTKDILSTPMHYVDQFCQLYPAITLVLKSDTTIIAHGSKRYFNVAGNDGLAVGGSGDVLAGIISGFYAQNNDALLASICGVYMHAHSADRLATKKSTYSIIPSAIIAELEVLLNALTKGENI